MRNSLLVFICLFVIAAAKVSAQCGPEFLETWESGTYTPAWTTGTAATTWNVTTSSPAVGSYCLNGNGNGSHLQGLRHNFTTPITPNYFSWYIKPDGSTADSYVVIGDAAMSATNCISFCYWVGTASPQQIRFVSSAVTFGYTVPATGVWYHIEMKNVNYTAHTFDIYINGVLMQTAFPFRSATQNSVSNIHLYNFTAGSTGYWDHIQVGEGSAPDGTITALDPLCAGDSTGGCDLTVSGGGAPYTYLWNTGATTEDISGWPAGSYEVVVTDTNGCADTVAATITDPAALAYSSVVSEVLCAGDTSGSISLTPSGGTPGYSVLWGDGATDFMLPALAAGAYTFTLSDTNGCSLDDTLTITEPLPLSISDSISEPLCNGGTGSIFVNAAGGTPGYSYIWSTGSFGSSVSGISAGAYDVTLTDTNGCSITSSFILNEPSAVSLSVSFIEPLCNGGTDGSIELMPSGGTPGYTYLWNTGDTTIDISGIGAGVYTYTVTDSNGCSITDSMMLIEPAAISVSASVTDAVGGTGGAIDITVSGGTPGYTYLWSNGATTEDIIGLTNGVYTVTVTDAHGCEFIYTDTVDFVVHIREGMALSTVCYPNPFADVLQWDIQTDASSSATLRLFNLSGSLAMPEQSFSLKSGANTMRMFTPQLPAGIYIWQLTSDQSVITGKVVRTE